jgi:hypothetical protein
MSKILAFLTLISLSYVIILTTGAFPHEATNTAGQPLGWRYSAWCCSDRDCKSVPASGIRETPNGYALQSTGEVVPYQDKRIKESPDGTFHVCQQAGDFDHGRVLCIYAPGRGY